MCVNCREEPDTPPPPLERGRVLKPVPLKPRPTQDMVCASPDRRTATKSASEGQDTREQGSRAQNRADREPVTYGCGGCDNRWQGVSRAHCSGCHRTFGGFGLFDRHRRLRGENGVCLDPETIVVKETGKRLMWLVNGLWVSEENPVGRKPPVRRTTGLVSDLRGVRGL